LCHLNAIQIKPSDSVSARPDLPNSNPPPRDRPENAEYSGDVLMTDPSPMEPLSKTTKYWDHPENSNMIDDASTDLQNSGQIIQLGGDALTESAQYLHGMSLNPT
jgi:hypothetical protein